MTNEMAENIKKPLITFVLFAYNQEKFIKEAILGAFSQTYSNLEIILSDDCSSDKTFDLMKMMVNEYDGPHKIILNCNKKNLGLINHVNKVCTQIATGDIIIFAAGDDISCSNRSETIQKIFKDKEIISVSSNFQYIDPEGVLIHKKNNYKKGYWELKDFIKFQYFHVIGCSRSYRREVFDLFGPLKDIRNVEDATLVFRALLLGKIYHENETLLQYRKGIESLSKDIDVSILNNVIKQRISDTETAIQNKKIDEITHKELNLLFERAKNKNKKRKSLQKNSSLFYFFKEIYFNKDFSKVDKKMMLKSLVKKRLWK